MKAGSYPSNCLANLTDTSRPDSAITTIFAVGPAVGSSTSKDASKAFGTSCRASSASRGTISYCWVSATPALAPHSQTGGMNSDL